MIEKKYFKYKSEIINSVYAFPARIKVQNDGDEKLIKIIGFSAEELQNDESFEEITEAEFLKAFNEVQIEITLSYHNQFSKENTFVKNESLKSEGY